MPSLKQLNEAIASYHADHPDVLMTVVVDATFGHRIDSKEVAEFETAIETNAFVAPPAGAVGRGDGFILSIAQKANASILSNDSYQEFHGEYAWLFDEGRLIGGKPVPHVGWVWVNRVPVRGPVSRRSVKEQKIVDKSPTRRRGQKRDADGPSISANAPMPVPTSLPPGAVMPAARRGAKADAPMVDAEASEDTRNRGRGGRAKQDQSKQDQSKQVQSKQNQSKQDQSSADHSRQDEGRQPQAKTTNDLLAFLSFVEHFPVGTAVTGVVESYSSHGAYVAISDVHGYVPLRLMADPAPRSAREAMVLGETVTLVVSSFGAARRSVDLAVPSMAPIVVAPTPKTRRGAAKRAAVTAEIEAAAIAAASSEEVAAVELAVATPVGRKRTSQKQPASSRNARKQPAAAAAAAAALTVEAPVVIAPTETVATPAKKTGRRTAKPAASQRAEPIVEAAVAPSVPTPAAKASPKRAASRRAARPVPPSPVQAPESPAEPPESPPLAKKTAARRRASTRPAEPGS